VDPFSSTGIKFNCVERLSLAARRLSMNSFVCDFLGHVFLDAPAMLQSLTFWRGSQQPAHLDYPYVSVQTRIPHLAASWTALEDVHADAGPLAYFPGSHKIGLIPPYDWGGGSVILTPESTRDVLEFTAHLAEQREKLALRREVFLPRRGDVLIWHGNLLHEGLPVRDFSRTRRSYVTHFTSRGSYPPGHGSVDVFERPVMQERLRLPSWKE
jgi:phytanoyl-CoA hydroxylase